jgi:hypothetical protein
LCDGLHDRRAAGNLKTRRKRADNRPGASNIAPLGGSGSQGIHGFSNGVSVRRETFQPVTFRATLALLSFAAIGATRAGESIGETGHGHLALLPQFNLVYRDGTGSSPIESTLELDPAVDFFATYTAGHLNALAEYVLDRHEADLERGQVGWFLENERIWIGRFHNPVGYWNTAFHHGGYMQTTVSRPGVVSFEDDGGIVPTHATGLFVQGRQALSNSKLSYDFGAGWGPGYSGKSGSLEAVDILRPTRGSHDFMTALRVAWQPEETENSEYGAFADYARIPTDLPAMPDVRQSLLGFFANWEKGRWRLLSELYLIRNRMRRPPGASTDNLVAGYLQAEFSIDERWTPYGRFESTTSGRGHEYLALFPGYVRQREMAGIAYRMPWGHQLLKLELGKTHTVADQFFEATLQWSAQFP